MRTFITKSLKEAYERIEGAEKLKLQYTLTKRYVDEERSSIVGVAQYELTIDESDNDGRKRFDKLE